MSPIARTEDPAYISLVPLTGIKAKSSSKVTVYDYNGNAFAQSSHYIDGANDICTINHVYTDGFCEITYPTGSGTATWLAKTSDFNLPVPTPDVPGKDREIPDGDYIIATTCSTDKSALYYLDIYGSDTSAPNGTNVHIHGPINGTNDLAAYDVWTLSSLTFHDSMPY